MKRAPLPVAILITTVTLGLMALPAAARETLRYARSAQVQEAFGKEALELFQKRTGIEVESDVCSSSAAALRLNLDFVSIASTSRRPQIYGHDRGFLMTPFCKDPLAIITNARCPVDNLTSDQLQDIFAKNISNWTQVGGPDQPIVRIVPDQDTGASKNFRRQAMRHKDLAYDIMTYKSTDAVEATAHLSGTISFVARGAVMDRKDIKVLTIDGLSPDDPDYPYSRIFYLVTKGMPMGPAGKLVDFVFSPDARAIMKKKGMVPVERKP